MQEVTVTDKLVVSSAPFNIAIVAYILMIAFVLWRWEENYGDKEAKPATSFIAALEVLHEGNGLGVSGCRRGYFGV